MPWRLNGVYLRTGIVLLVLLQTEFGRPADQFCKQSLNSTPSHVQPLDNSSPLMSVLGQDLLEFFNQLATKSGGRNSFEWSTLAQAKKLELDQKLGRVEAERLFLEIRRQIERRGNDSLLSREQSASLPEKQMQDFLSFPIQKLKGHTAMITSLEFLDDQSVVTASADLTIRIWSLKKENPLFYLIGPGGGDSLFAISPDRRWIVTGSRLMDPELNLWDARDGKRLTSLKIDIRELNLGSFSSGGNFFVYTGVQTSSTGDPIYFARVLDAQGLSHKTTVNSGTPIYEGTFSRDEESLLLKKEKSVLMIKGRGAGEQWEINEQAIAFGPHWPRNRAFTIKSLGPPPSTEVSPQPRLNSISIWDVENKQRLVEIPVYESGMATGISPDGTWLATLNPSMAEREVQLWDTETGRLRGKIALEDEGTHALVISPDNQFLLSLSSAFAATLWNLRTGQKLARYRSDRGPLNRLEGPLLKATFSLDSRKILGSGRDGIAHIWVIHD